jgi:glutamine synthetase
MLTDYQETRGPELERLAAELSDDGVRFAHVQFPIFPGPLRSKLTTLSKALDPEPHGFNSAIFTLTHGDGNPGGDVVFESAFTGSHNGWPDVLSFPDPASVVRLPWRPETAAVILNTLMPDGSRCPLDVRAAISDLEQRAATLGFETRFAFEYEVFLFEANDEALNAGRYSELKPYGRDLAYCDHLRHPGFEALARDLIGRMSSIGIGVAGFHTEYGRGMAEFALTPKPALAAADAAGRVRLYLSELCEERGLVATFMARCTAPGSESSTGAHLHQSLLRDGQNAFAEPDSEGLSETARHYLGGLLSTMTDLHLIFRPTVNSYRRMNRDEWSPVDVSWGLENRTAAVRAVTKPGPGGVRLEHRVAGADANPYLQVLATLGGGLHGIEQRIDPGAPSGGDQDAEPLSTSLTESIAAFEHSDVAREIFGPDLVDHYLTSRRAEWDSYAAWLSQNVTEFEFRRYFEAH